MSKFMKKCLSVLCCIMIVFTSYGTVFADDYKKYESSDDTSTDSKATYYIIEGQDFNKLFDFGLSDVGNLFDWVWDMKTYTVIKKYENDKGETIYKSYFNTPNLQQLVKNQVVQNINDGYTDNAYNVEETEWLVPVGPDSGKDNVITRFGFNVPSPLYQGEYPTEIMTVAGVIPTGFWDTLWRAITSLFGASFIKAPDASNFNTITYMNHGYADKEDYLVELVRQYYIPYFVARIAQDKYDGESDLAYCKDYFTDTDEFIEETVTDAENLAAETYINEYKDLYKKIIRTVNGYNMWSADSEKKTTHQRFGVTYKPNAFAGASADTLNKYLGKGGSSDGIIIPIAHSNKGYSSGSIACTDVPCAHKGNGIGASYHENTTGIDPLYLEFTGWILANEDYINAIKDWYAVKPTDYTYARAAVLKGIILNDSVKSKYSDMPAWGTDGSAVYNYFDGKINDNAAFTEFITSVLTLDTPTPKLYYRYYYKDQLTSSNYNASVAKERAGKEYEDFELNSTDYTVSTKEVEVIDIVNPSNKDEVEKKQKEKNSAESDMKAAKKAMDNALAALNSYTGSDTAHRDNLQKAYDDAKEKYDEAKKKYDGITVPKAEYKNKKKINITLTDRTYTHLFYKDTTDNNKEIFISYTDLESFYSITLPYYKFEYEKWVNEKYQRKKSDYEKAVKKTNDYDDFIDKINLINKEKGYTPDKDKMTGIAYSQCLITNTGKDGECKNNAYGSEASITVGSLYAYNGLYHLTPGFKYKEYLNGSSAKYYTKQGTGESNENKAVYESYKTLTTEQAQKVINFIKNSAGPYYAEVMANIVKLICLNAAEENDKGPIRLMQRDDVRVMPYDVSTLTSDDAKNYTVADPRVEKYKETVIGSFIANFSMSFYVNWAGIFSFLAPQKTLLAIIGKVTEFSVFMQQLCNFDKFDEFGLSPTTMWNENTGFGFILMSALAIFFIFKTVKSVIDLCKYGKRGSGQVFVGFLCLILELGLITAITADPAKTWNAIKKVETTIINAGEMGTFYSNPDMKYLFGDEGDLEVTYYLPYLDAWSKYNTGYGLLADQQKIDFSKQDSLPELKDFDPKGYATIGTNKIGHWSVLLMDAFEYHGRSDSIATSVEYTNPKSKTVTYVNGTTINNNAYRVVDHFLAPRVTLTDKGDSIALETKQNENYNGAFQEGVADLFVKLLLALFICFLSLVKLLIFFWQWYMFYIFFFEAILGKLAERKTWKQIFLQTFAPTAALVLLGAYSGIVLMIGMSLEGFFGVVMIILLFLLTFQIVGWWYRLAGGQYFPGTLKPVYALYCMMFTASANRQRSQLSHKELTAVRDDIKTNFSNEDDDFKEAFSKFGVEGSLQRQMDVLYDKDGNLKKGRFNGRKYDRIKGNLIDHYEREKSQGHTTNEQNMFFERLKAKDEIAYENYKDAFRKKYGIKDTNTKQNNNFKTKGKENENAGQKGSKDSKTNATSAASGTNSEQTKQPDAKADDTAEKSKAPSNEFKTE